MRRGGLQDWFPRFAPIGRLKQAAFATVRPQMTHRRDINHVRPFWIDNDARNRVAVFQPNVLPIFTAIS